MAISAFLDANVLASKTQRDWLFKISLESPYLLGLYSSIDVLAETVTVFRIRNPSAPEDAVNQLVNLVSQVLVDVVADSPQQRGETLVAQGDQHVHRGVLASGAEVLVTDNLKDFPPFDSRTYRVVSPDEILCELYALSPRTIRRVATSERVYWAQQIVTTRLVKSLENALRDANCSRFAAIVETLGSAEPEAKDPKRM